MTRRWSCCIFSKRRIATEPQSHRVGERDEWTAATLFLSLSFSSPLCLCGSVAKTTARARVSRFLVSAGPPARNSCCGWRRRSYQTLSRSLRRCAPRLTGRKLCACQQSAPVSLGAQCHSRVTLSLLTKRLRRLINLRRDRAPFILVGSRDLRLICHDPDFAHFIKDPLSGYEYRSSQEALRRRVKNWRVKPAREEDSNVEQWGL